MRPLFFVGLAMLVACNKPKREVPPGAQPAQVDEGQRKASGNTVADEQIARCKDGY